MGKTRALGGLLCIASVVVIILHIAAGYFGFFGAVGRPSLAFALPVTVGLLVVCGLGIWLGWIMATTKEVAPPPLETKTEKEAAEGKKK